MKGQTRVSHPSLGSPELIRKGILIDLTHLHPR